MAFTLKIYNGVIIELGETKEELMYDLDGHDIKYIVPFDKTNAEGVKETILQIPELRVEVSILNDIITYIKSGCNEYSIVFDGTNVNRKDIKVINQLKDTILKTFGVDKKQMFIERINLRNFDTMVIFKTDTKKIRLHLMSDLRGNVYINTLRYL